MFLYGVGVSVLLLLGNSIDAKKYQTKNATLGDSYEASVTATASWTYECVDGFCKKQVLCESGRQVSLETCSMLCSTPQLWPLPKNIVVRNEFPSPFKVDSIQFSKIQESYTLLSKAAKVFSLNVNTGAKYRDTKTTSFLNINIVCSNCEDSSLSLTTDESYSLETKNLQGNITATIWSSNFYGIRHGLETLSQLTWWDPVDGKHKVLTDVTIQDRPAFPYRGLMVDVSRNFFTLKQLKKIVNGMAASKLNVLHLHVSDTQSFPLILSSLPSLGIYGSYGSDMVYTEADIKKLRLHAQLRGIRLVLEVDAPGHLNAGWNSLSKLGEPKITMCNQNPMNDGQLNPDNPRALEILETIYKNLIKLNDQHEIFHIGGDEVDAKCWINTRAAAGYSDMQKFQMDYMNKMIERLKNANEDKYPDNIVIWSSAITNRYDLGLVPAEKIVVQYWLGSIAPILYAGHSVIYSPVDYWYLDCGFGPWNRQQNKGVCDPYKSWRDVYQHRPWKIHGYMNQTLGGEACLWSELVDVDDLETRIWPRASALGERLWSDTPSFNKFVYTRLSRHRTLLQARGLKVAGIWPKWCTQNPGIC